MRKEPVKHMTARGSLMKCPICGAETEKVGIDRYDCTKGCGVYLIHKLRTYKSKYKDDKIEG